MRTGPVTFAVLATKGGVGKTTVVGGLAASCAMQSESLETAGRPIVLVDMDGQGNLGDSLASRLPVDLSSFATSSDALMAGMDDVNFRLGLNDLVPVDSPSQEDVFLLPAGQQGALLRAQDRMSMEPGGEQVLRRVLSGLTSDALVFIDTPPAAGRLTINAVCAASLVLGVMNPARWSVSGVSDSLAMTERMNALGLSDAVFLGMVVNKFAGGRRVVRDFVIEDVASAGLRVFPTLLPTRAAFEGAEYVGDPLPWSEPRSLLAGAFFSLAREVFLAGGVGVGAYDAFPASTPPASLPAPVVSSTTGDFGNTVNGSVA